MTIVSALSTTQWFPVGPSPISTPGVSLGFSAGRVEVAAPDPTNADVMYVGASGGGVWKTGTWSWEPPSWIPVADDQPSLNFSGYHSLLVHPASHNLILGAVSGTGAGILKSTNAGLGWQLLANNQFEGAMLGSLAVHPSDTQILYVSVWRNGPGAGVYKSIDGGLNWQNMTAFHGGWVSDVIVAKFNPQVLYAGLIPGAGATDTAGVYRSGNGGTSWQPMSGLPSSLFLSGGPFGPAIRLESASATGTVYVTLFQSDIQGNATVDRYKTANDGNTWSKLGPTPGTPEFRPWHLLLAVDSRNANHVLVNDAYVIYESTDGGKTWSQAETIGDDWVNLTFDANNDVVATADRNLYRYAPQSKEWLAKEGNLQVTQLYDITLDQQNPDLAYGVAQDHPDAMKFGGSILWDYLPKGGGETGKVLVDPGNSNVLHVSHPLDPANLVQRSTNGGQNWTTILTTDEFGPEDYDLAYSVQKAFAMDPTSSSRLLLGTTLIWETTDALSNSPTWTKFTSVLSTSDQVSDQYITALAISSNGTSVYAATADGHVWVKHPNKFWEQRDQGLFGAGAGQVVDLRIDPADPLHAFAVTNGPGGNNVWHLAHSGKVNNWVNVSGDLPANLSTASIFVDWQYSTPALFVGTARAAYHSVNLGQHWEKFGLYLPNTLVTDLQALPAQNVLAAGTFGRGVWEILIPSSKIAGKVFDDLDGGGIPDENDPGMSGVTVFLDTNGNGLPDDYELRTNTDARGNYRFARVPPGTYCLRQIPPAGYVQTTPHFERITVSGSDLRGKNFGNHLRRERADEAYRFVADLNLLPGREPGRSIAAKGEFDRLTRK